MNGLSDVGNKPRRSANKRVLLFFRPPHRGYMWNKKPVYAVAGNKPRDVAIS